MIYEERFYREQIRADGLIPFEVMQSETDLLILAHRDLTKEAEKAVRLYRSQLRRYISKHPRFQTSLEPINVSWFRSPKIVREMAWAGKKAKVGPMAAVAGAIAEYVGKELLRYSPEVIVENGGDIFMKTAVIRRVGVFAGNSPLSNKVAIEIDPLDSPLGICTSAGTVGHSLSFGKAEAVVVLAKSTSLADAAATAIGNVVKEKADLEKGLALFQKIPGLMGVLIVKDDQLAVRGKVKLVTGDR